MFLDLHFYEQFLFFWIIDGHPVMGHNSPPNWKRSLSPRAIESDVNAWLTSSDVCVRQQEAQIH